MNKVEKQKIKDKYDKEKTPYDNQLKCSIKEISSLKQILSFWDSIRDSKDYRVFSIKEVEKSIKILSDRLEFQKKNKAEIENKIYHYKKENGTK